MANAEDDNPTDPADDQGVRWFNRYVERIENQPSQLPLRCPCCLCHTLDERGGYDICPLCFWEDDGQDDYDADDIRGGPNGRLSLTVARKNYSAYGACDQKSIQHVRKPEAHELPDQA